MRSWVRVPAVAFGSAMLLGAGQFGAAYGLGALTFNHPYLPQSLNHWNAQLTWVAFFALIATVGGTALSRASSVGLRAGAALAAATGSALTIIALVGFQTRDVHLPVSLDPELTVTLSALVAAGLGIPIALFVVNNPPLSTNLWWYAALMFVLVVPSHYDTIQYGQMNGYYEPPRLGVFDVGGMWVSKDRAAYTLPIAALVVGLAVAFAAWMRGTSRLLVWLSGAAGPLLVAFAYLIGGPGLSNENNDQINPYAGAMFAIFVGLLVAGLIALLPRRSATPTL